MRNYQVIYQNKETLSSNSADNMCPLCFREFERIKTHVSLKHKKEKKNFEFVLKVK